MYWMMPGGANFLCDSSDLCIEAKVLASTFLDYVVMGESKSRLAKV